LLTKTLLWNCALKEKLTKTKSRILEMIVPRGEEWSRVEVEEGLVHETDKGLGAYREGGVIVDILYNDT